jgi:SAM-dependent methyltransferase
MYGLHKIDIMKKTLANLISKLMLVGFSKEDVHLTRFLQYESLGNLDLALGRNGNLVASISGSERLCKKMGFDASCIVKLDHPAYDIRNLPFPDSYFDVCVADQVLEHVDSEPNRVFREVSRVLKPGGVFVNATVMTYPIHYGPKDMWRFTPDGLEHLFTSNEFEIVTRGSWGGCASVILLALGQAMLPVPVWKAHPLRKIAESNGANWPIVIWAVGRNVKEKK